MTPMAPNIFRKLFSAGGAWMRRSARALSIGAEQIDLGIGLAETLGEQ